MSQLDATIDRLVFDVIAAVMLVAVLVLLAAVVSSLWEAAWWQKLIAHFEQSGQSKRYVSRFNLVDRIFKLVQWLGVIGLIFKLTIEKTTIDPFYKVVIFGICLGLFTAILLTLPPLWVALVPAPWVVGRGRVAQFLIRLRAAVMVLLTLGALLLAFRAILIAYLPTPPPPPTVDTHSPS